MTDPETPPDVLLDNAAGGLVARPETAAGQAWLETHCAGEAWRWVDGAVEVEGRECARRIASALIEDGLVVWEER